MSFIDRRQKRSARERRVTCTSTHVVRPANNKVKTEMGVRHHLPLFIVFPEPLRNISHIIVTRCFPPNRFYCQTLFESCCFSLPKNDYNWIDVGFGEANKGSWAGVSCKVWRDEIPPAGDSRHASVNTDTRDLTEPIWCHWKANNFDQNRMAMNAMWVGNKELSGNEIAAWVRRWVQVPLSPMINEAHLRD